MNNVFGRIERAQQTGLADAGRANDQDLGAALLAQSFVGGDDFHDARLFLDLCEQ